MGYADVIFVISYGFEDQLKEIADKNPDKIFVNIDTVVENSADTITSVDFIEEESAYLAGVVAGMLTTDTSVKNINADKIVGVVGGDVDPVVDAFIYAYEKGATVGGSGDCRRGEIAWWRLGRCGQRQAGRASAL